LYRKLCKHLVEIKDENALKVFQDLQGKQFINRLSNPDLNYHVFPSEPMSPEEFISVIEQGGSIKSL